MSPEFETLLAEHVLFGLDAMISLAEFQNEQAYEVDLQAGIIGAGDQTAPICAIGSWAKSPTNSWLWGWANPGWQDLPEHVMSASNQLKAYGETHNIPELIAAETPMDDDAFGFHVAAIACGLTGAQGAMQYEHSGGSAFFIMPTLPFGPSGDVSRVMRTISQGLQNYDVPHRTAIESYLKQKTFTVSGTDDTLEAELNGSVIKIGFDELGRAGEINAHINPDSQAGPAPNDPLGVFGAAPSPPEAQPKKSGGFFSRLFGK